MPEVEDEDVASFVTRIVGLVLERLIEYQAFSSFPGPGLTPDPYPAALRNRQTHVAAESKIRRATVRYERRARL